MGQFQPQKKFFLAKIMPLHLNPQKTWKIQFLTFSGFFEPKIKKGIWKKLIFFCYGSDLTKNRRKMNFFDVFFWQYRFLLIFWKSYWLTLEAPRPLFLKKILKSKGTFIKKTFQELSIDTKNLMVGPDFDQEI